MSTFMLKFTYSLICELCCTMCNAKLVLIKSASEEYLLRNLLGEQCQRQRWVHSHSANHAALHSFGEIHPSEGEQQSLQFCEMQLYCWDLQKKQEDAKAVKTVNASLYKCSLCFYVTFKWSALVLYLILLNAIKLHWENVAKVFLWESKSYNKVVTLNGGACIQ